MPSMRMHVAPCNCHICSLVSLAPLASETPTQHTGSDVKDGESQVDKGCFYQAAVYSQQRRQNGANKVSSMRRTSIVFPSWASCRREGFWSARPFGIGSDDSHSDVCAKDNSCLACI